MTRVRDHYFEVRKDGTYIYLGSTNPERIDRGEETDMFFSGGIDNPVCVIRGQMATIQPPEPTQEETCPDCGHAVSLHHNGYRGYTCRDLGCICTTPASYFTVIYLTDKLEKI